MIYSELLVVLVRALGRVAKVFYLYKIFFCISQIIVCNNNGTYRESSIIFWPDNNLKRLLFKLLKTYIDILFKENETKPISGVADQNTDDRFRTSRKKLIFIC